jgi:hypothetical protein
MTTYASGKVITPEFFRLYRSNQLELVGSIGVVRSIVIGQEYRGAMVAGHPEDADAYEGWQVDRHDAIIAAATAAGELPLKASPFPRPMPCLSPSPFLDQPYFNVFS